MRYCNSVDWHRCVNIAGQKQGQGRDVRIQHDGSNTCNSKHKVKIVENTATQFYLSSNCTKEQLGNIINKDESNQAFFFTATQTALLTGGSGAVSLDSMTAVSALSLSGSSS